MSLSSDSLPSQSQKFHETVAIAKRGGHGCPVRLHCVVIRAPTKEHVDAWYKTCRTLTDVIERRDNGKLYTYNWASFDLERCTTVYPQLFKYHDDLQFFPQTDAEAHLPEDDALSSGDDTYESEYRMTILGLTPEDWRFVARRAGRGIVSSVASAVERVFEQFQRSSSRNDRDSA